jgi:uncharacterized protein DUF3467
MNDDREQPGSGRTLLGSYANYFEVGHNAWEVVLDFGQLYPGNGQPRVHTRIIMSPTYAKALLRMLEESLLRCEQTFGSIDDRSKPADP